MGVFYPPMNPALRLLGKPTIFLGGTIDMGNSENWQLRFTQKLERNYTVFNPRRSDWDSSWNNDFESPQFYQQVNWELNALERSDIVLINFLPGSKSPISLMELGKFSDNTKQTCVVLCPKGYERKGNVDIFCNRYDIPLYEDENLLMIDLLGIHLEKFKK